MTRKTASTAAILFVAAAVLGISLAQAPVPRLAGRVNDYADLLDKQQRAAIEGTLAQFEANTTTQIALLTVPSLEGEDIEGFSMRVAEKWKIGQKGKDNGVILVVAPKDRKVRIEVGYGLEGALTDLEASRIIRHVIVPAFKSGNYYAGIVGGLDGIMKAAQGEFAAPERSTGYRSYEGRGKPSVLSMILIGLVFLILISTRTGRWILLSMLLFGGRGGGSGRGSGGGFSGGGGGFGGGGASGSW